MRGGGRFGQDTWRYAARIIKVHLYYLDLMDYPAKLQRLEYLRQLVDRYNEVKAEPTDEGKNLRVEIAEVYGEVADVFDAILGKSKVEVPKSGGLRALYPNYFEAGFLSGRTFHAHDGRSELLKVIGAVKARLATPAVGGAAAKPGSGRVFVVHGRNEEALLGCARFLEKLQLPVTILREQPNQGRTLIEKFVDYSDAAFAVVLLTGDDRGGLADTPCEEQALRARQNVILELGFFLGKLGRERVCVLYQEDVEIPSDYNGVAFVPIDPRQAWRFELAKEMKAAGLPVDMNLALS